MKKSMFAAAAAATLLAGTALAQTTQTNPASSSTTQMNSPSSATQMSQQTAPAATNTAGKGITMAKTAPMAVRFMAAKPADLMTSRLIGLNVYNNQNEKLGEIEDLAFQDGKTLTGVVLSVGGFLGMNERYVMIDPSTIVVNKDSDDDWKAYVDTSRDTLKNAPKFEYGEVKS